MSEEPNKIEQTKQIKERVTTFELNEINIKTAFVFQFIVLKAYENIFSDLSAWKTSCRKMAKFLKINEIVFESVKDKIVQAKIELSYKKEDHYILEVDLSKPKNLGTSLIMQQALNPDKIKTSGTMKQKIDVFNVKFLESI